MRPLLCAAAILFALPACADPAYLTVTGQGSVSAAPNAVIINAGVVSSASTAHEALGQNSRTMTAVFDTLKKLGVPEKSIRTANLNLSPQYAPAAANTIAFPSDRPITGYRVNNTVSVTLDDPARAGAVLDALVAAGANQAGGLSYIFKNDQDLLSEARTDAVKNAIARAHTYADAAGVTLGAIHAISDTGTVFPGPATAARLVANLAPPPPAPIGVGEQTLHANVTVSWEIKP
ncbi:MAG TPA: SIMPL domain-containing protein [Rhizomicrobium sp.]